MNNLLRVINAYIHDFASAMWLATLLVVYWTNRFFPPSGSEEFFFGFKRDFFFIGIGSLVVILLTGVGRTYSYKSGQYGEDAEKERKEILIVKHILGLLIYGAGTFWQYTMVYG